MLIAAAAAAPEAARRRSRLLSCEFLFYYAAVGLGALALVREAYLFSLPYSEPYSQTFDGRPLYRLSGLREGWLWGRRAIDLRDHQYAAFRSALPALTAAALGFLALSRLVAVASRGSLSARLAFNAVFSLAFLLHAHGACVFFVAALAAANWALASALRGTRLLVPATWIFALTTLFANAAYDGYRFADLSAGLAWLDQHRGATRWQLHFNLVLLRLVSFNLDSHWAAAGRGEDATRVRRHLLTCAACRSGAQPTVDAGKADAVPTNTPCLWMREKLPQPPAAWHSPLVYTVYLFYTPLLLAGPTMTFNSFVSQLRQPPTHLTGSVLLQYFARLLFAAALLEGALHVAYVFAVSQGDAWREFSREQILALAWTTLNVMWLKFLVLWRFFRMWALADGMEPEENMNRCVNNVYSLQGFWRAWHRSFNRWLVRYIYVPLGGSHGSLPRRVANVFCVFLFVAVWHEQNLKLLVWGLLIALFFVPELVLQHLLTRESLAWLPRKPYFRYLHGLAAALNMWLMAVANLVGYNLGLDGTLEYLRRLLCAEGALFVAIVIAVLAMNAQIMFEIRRLEATGEEGDATRDF